MRGSDKLKVQNQTNPYYPMPLRANHTLLHFLLERLNMPFHQ